MNDLFVVIEWNQAGGLPHIPDQADIHTRLEDAAVEAAERTMYAAPRRDRYVVARVELLDEDDQ